METIAKTNSKSSKNSPWALSWKRLCRDKKAMTGLVIVVILVLCALFPGTIAPEGFDDQNYADALQWPGSNHWLGTDQYGRDILSRIIWGARTSIIVGFISVGISAVIGSILGAVAAFYGKRVDNIIMRALDIIMAIPSTLLAISIAAALGSGLFNLMVAVGIGAIPTYARIVRGSVMTVSEQEYIEAARAGGASDLRIIVRHIFPNVLAPIIVQATMGIAGAILNCAALSFIGLGIQPPTPEWGSMLSTGKQFLLNDWYVAVFPGLAIMITILALNLLGDGLRDALDPRMKK